MLYNEDLTQLEVDNLVEFWRWQSEVTEKKWQEMNSAVQERIHV
jgi:hypothetical protein